MAEHQATQKKETLVTFVLPPLPYPADALEPYIDKQTMEIHHDKHHGAYVTNLNKALDGHADLQKLSIEELLAKIESVPENIRTAVRNNGGGHINHSMFWTIMGPGAGGAPVGHVAQAITGSLAGIPCMSVPCGTTAEGLPVGMQILTGHFAETTMFRLADAFERTREN